MESVADAADAKIRDECSPGKPMTVFSPTAHKVSNHGNSHRPMGNNVMCCNIIVLLLLGIILYYIIE